MLIRIQQSVIADGLNLPEIGSLQNVPEALARHLIEIGAALPLVETKVDPLPPEVKKNEPSESSQAAPVVTPKTRKRSVRKSKPSQ